MMAKTPDESLPVCRVVYKKDGTQSLYIGNVEIPSVRSYSYNMRAMMGQPNNVRIEILVGKMISEYEK